MKRFFLFALPLVSAVGLTAWAAADQSSSTGRSCCSQVKAGCACEGCKCPVCNGSVCTCETCECDVCGCAK